MPVEKALIRRAPQERLGGDVVMLGCVWDDSFGSELMRSLSSAGVDVSRIRRSATCSTGTAVIYVEKSGDNNIVVIPGANDECDEAYLKENDDAFSQCDCVLLQMEIPAQSVFYAIRRASELGKTIILNPAPAPDSIPADILKILDYITPNETELTNLTDGSHETAEAIEASARKLTGLGVGGVLITVGKRGAMMVNAQTCRTFPTIDVAVVDTTAAGDCFNAAFVVALAEDKSMEDAIAFANAAAALSVIKKGAQNSLPTREAVTCATKNTDKPVLRLNNCRRYRRIYARR